MNFKQCFIQFGVYFWNVKTIKNRTFYKDSAQQIRKLDLGFNFQVEQLF